MFRIVSPDLDRLAVGAKVFPKPLRASMRKQLALIAKDGANDAKKAIRGMPVKGDVPYRQGSGLRQQIANAIKVSAGVNTGSGASVAIRVANTGALAQFNRATVAKYLDSKSWRHPVYGKNAWVEQNPYPYFKSVIERKAPEMRAAAAEAIRAATLATIPNVR